MLYRMVTLSSARIRIEGSIVSGTLGGVLAARMERLSALELTGALVWEEGYFMEVLEGLPQPLGEFWEQLRQDPHHSDLKRLELRPVRRREYATWALGRARQDAGPSALVRKLQTITPRADEVRTHVRDIISGGVMAETGLVSETV